MVGSISNISTSLTFEVLPNWKDEVREALENKELFKKVYGDMYVMLDLNLLQLPDENKNM